MLMTDAVARLTNYNFGQIYDLRAMEFFAYVAYLQRKREDERKRIDEFKRTRRY